MPEVKPEEILDLKGIACPQNSAMALLKLEGIKAGSILEVIIDDGEPIKNVPNSIKDEGHKIVSMIKVDKVWKILIKKM